MQREREWIGEGCDQCSGEDNQSSESEICWEIVENLVDNVIWESEVICEGIVDDVLGTALREEQDRGRTMERRGATVRREEDVEEGGRGPNGGRIVVGSCDVKALYPSLKKKECAEVVGRLVRETKMEIRGVN